MINSIANYKESLSRIANEVFDADEDELENSQLIYDSPSSGRRNSRRHSSRFASPVSKSPVPNGIGSDPGSNDEIAKYKSDIQKLMTSEAEIKKLAFSYAAVLKEKEEQLLKLREENGSLKKNLDAKDSIGLASKDENSKTLSNNNKASTRSQRNVSQGNSRIGNNLGRMSVTKQDGFSNGSMQTLPYSTGNERASQDSETIQLKAQLDNERETASVIKLKLKEECQLREHSQRELQNLRIEKEKTTAELKEVQNELTEKIAELSRLQVELSRRDTKGNDSLENLKNMISRLEKENEVLKTEKKELESALSLHIKNAPENIGNNGPGLMDKKAIEEMELSIWKLKETLEHTSKERDKAWYELDRLKQHLLDKELEESDKMDEDNRIIDELREAAEHQRAHISQLESALKQEALNKEEIMKFKSDELQKSNDMIKELRQKLVNCMSVVDSKNVELQNLQTALGQYYAESEAKERLERELVVAKEESAKLSERLKAQNLGIEMSKREKEEMLAKFSQAERMLLDGKRAMQKLEEDNSKLRRALEQNMTRLNRMSLDSDNYVDRRIVIKLLVTYFQRNHSKEVLDLMVRMLGFSEEDKQRIGLAQSGGAGKGVVRGVLGLPGRLVGGILGGSSSEPSSQSSNNQSFADLWVDFLLKETEERERRESEEAAARMSSSNTKDARNSSPNTSNNTFSTSNHPSNQYIPSRQQSSNGNPDSEFATVPLNSIHPSGKMDSYSYRTPPRY